MTQTIRGNWLKDGAIGARDMLYVLDGKDGFNDRPLRWSMELLGLKYAAPVVRDGHGMFLADSACDCLVAIGARSSAQLPSTNHTKETA